jgi:hypothetical protein
MPLFIATIFLTREDIWTVIISSVVEISKLGVDNFLAKLFARPRSGEETVALLNFPNATSLAKLGPEKKAKELSKCPLNRSESNSSGFEETPLVAITKTVVNGTYSINSNPIYKNNFSTQMEKLLVELEKFFNSKILFPYDFINSKLKLIEDLEIYIENQPVFKNPIMKSISVGIYTFFCMKKILYPKIISSINFINPTVKTKQDFIIKLNNLIGIKSNIKDFKSYTCRKEFSEDIINQIIPKLSYSREHINNIISISNYILTKKKDDLADTLLYQLYVIIYLI